MHFHQKGKNSTKISYTRQRYKRKTFLWKATWSVLWTFASVHLCDQVGVITTRGAALICLLYFLMRSCLQSQIDFMPFTHNSGSWMWHSQGWDQEPEADSESPHSRAMPEPGAQKAAEVKMFINTQGPKRKEPITYESAGEDVGSLLFSWCEWITSLILRDSEVSSAISCDNIYSAGKGEKGTIKMKFFMVILWFSEQNKSSIDFISY